MIVWCAGSYMINFNILLYAVNDRFAWSTAHRLNVVLHVRCFSTLYTFVINTLILDQKFIFMSLEAVYNRI